MTPGTDLRFEDSSNGTLSGRHYDVRDPSGRVAYRFDTRGQCITHPTAFFGPDDGQTPLFTMRAKGRLMNMTYFVDTGREGPRLGTVHGKGLGFCWKVLDSEDRELVRFLDPTSMKEAMLRTALGGSADTYAVVRTAEGEGTRVLARIHRTPRPDPPDAPGGWRAVVRRVFRLHDWTLSPDIEIGNPTTQALLVAGTTLLIEHQIRQSG